MEPYIITIARGFGSGGKEIGQKLSARLGIPCYERQILQMASDQSGLNESLFANVDEKLKGGLLRNQLLRIPFYKTAEPQDKYFESDRNLFQIQADIIRRLAENTSCIIIGKCADFILKDTKNVFSFYIEAPREACVKSICAKMSVTEKEAHNLIEKTDRYRADYYYYYTHGNQWTNPINYDMTLNSAKIGRECCVDVMENYIKMRLDLTS